MEVTVGMDIEKAIEKGENDTIIDFCRMSVLSLVKKREKRFRSFKNGEEIIFEITGFNVFKSSFLR